MNQNVEAQAAKKNILKGTFSASVHKEKARVLSVGEWLWDLEKIHKPRSWAAG